MQVKFSFLKDKYEHQETLTKRTRFVLGGSILIFALAFIIAIFIINARAKYESNITGSETILNSMSGSIHTNMVTYKDISRLVMLNEAVTTYLKAEEADAGLKNDARFGVLDVIIVCSGVDSVCIFRNDKAFMNTGRGEYFLDEQLMETEEWQSKILDKRGGAVVTINCDGAFCRKNGVPIVSIGRAIYDINTQQRIGILQLNISVQALEQVTAAQQQANVCIVSTDGLYLAGDEELAALYTPEYASEEAVHNTQRYKKSRVMISGQQVDDMPLVVMCAAGRNATEIPIETMIVMLLILGAFAVSIGIAAVFVTTNITDPVNELSTAIEETRQTGYLKKIDVNIPNNEIGMLAENYNSMIEHLNTMFTELIEKEKSVQKAEMRVLHEQLKPHFLYNSLETISYMAFDAGAKDVHEALETLGSFYRNFLSKGEREIPLRTEITIIKNYLSLQKLRYGDIIRDEYDIAEETLDLKIPKLILQPLVENSIYHGIRLTGEEGTISITTKIVGKDLHIVVRDTGVGMSQDTIDKILSKEYQDESEESRHSGFGLRGTIERIRYYCNDEDVVTIRSEVGEFTEIELVIKDEIVVREENNV